MALEGNSGSTTLNFSVLRTGDLTQTSSVDWSIAQQGGLDGSDFAGGVLPSGRITFGPGEFTRVISISVAGDLTIEGDETVTITLSNATGCTVGTASASIVVENDDVAPMLPVLTIVALTASIQEGNSGTRGLTFVVSRSHTSNSPAATWTVSGQADSSDFSTPMSGTVTFAPGETTATITLTVVSDTTVEPDEAVTVTLSNPVQATLGNPAAATATILNDDSTAVPSPVPVVASGLTLSVAESVMIGATVGTVTATNNPSTYSITGGTGQGKFAISNSGVITTSILLDYETVTSYTLLVTATNSAGTSTAQTVTVSVADVLEAPVVATGLTFSVLENRPLGTVVGTVTATNSPTSYSITAGNSTARFAISNSGTITLIGALDYETTSSYSITVKATNAAGTSVGSTVAISVGDAPEMPAFPLETLSGMQIILGTEALTSTASSPFVTQSGGTVTAWADQFGTATNATSAGGGANAGTVTYLSSVSELNGLPALHFDGSSYLNTQGGTVTTPDGNLLMLANFVRRTPTGGWEVPFGLIIEGQSNPYFAGVAVIIRGDQIALRAFGFGEHETAGITLPTGAAATVAVVVTNNTAQLFVDDTASDVIPLTAGANVTARLMVGGTVSLYDPFGGGQDRASVDMSHLSVGTPAADHAVARAYMGSRIGKTVAGGLAAAWAAHSGSGSGSGSGDTGSGSNTGSGTVGGDNTADVVDTSVVQTTPSARSNITTMAFANSLSTAATAPTVQRVVGFARGDVPGARGDGVRLTLGNLPMQQDAETYWSDGSLKTAVVTARPGNLGANGTSSSFAFGCEVGAPDRTAAVTLAQVAANSDIRIRLTGYSLGNDTFELSVNDVIANGTEWPWGNNPTMGYRTVARGPHRNGWAMWGMAKRVGDGAIHKWLKVKLWVDALSPTSFAVRGKILQSNLFGAHPAGTVGAQYQPSHVFTAMLLNGATVAHRWGGAQDPRVRSVDGALFDPSSQQIMTNGWFAQGTPFALAPAAGATLPGGLQTGTPYFAGYHNDRFMLWRSRYGITWGTYPGAWAPNIDIHGYDVGVIGSNGLSYVNRPVVGGNRTDGKTGNVAPSGPGPIVDGQITWDHLNAGPITSAGSGQINFIPLLVTFPYGGVDLYDMNTHERVMIGTTHHGVVAVPDISYQCHKSNLLPPYHLGVTVSPLANPPDSWPGASYDFPSDLNTTGNSPGDERIGMINHSAARALLRPADANHRRQAIRMSVGFSDYHIHQEDHASGLVPVTNNGFNRQGGAYHPTMPIHAALQGPPSNTPGVEYADGALLHHNGVYERYNRNVDSSHMPVPGVGPYILTGDDAFLDQVLQQFSTNTNSEWYVPNDGTYAGQKWYRIQATNSGQEGRGCGWATTLLGNVNHLLPANRPERRYISDIYRENATYVAAIYKTFTPSRRALGLYHGQTDQTQIWMADFAFWAFSREALRGEHPGWRDVVVNHMAKFCVGRMDAAGTGCAYYAPARYIYVNIDGPPPTEDNFMSSWSDIYAKNLKYSPERMFDNSYNPGAPQPYNGCPPQGILREYNSVGANTLVQYVYDTAVFACKLGLPNATAILNDVSARLTYSNGNSDFLPTWAEYPEWAMQYVP